MTASLRTNDNDEAGDETAFCLKSNELRGKMNKTGEVPDAPKRSGAMQRLSFIYDQRHVVMEFQRKL